MNKVPQSQTLLGISQHLPSQSARLYHQNLGSSYEAQFVVFKSELAETKQWSVR